VIRSVAAARTKPDRLWRAVDDWPVGDVGAVNRRNENIRHPGILPRRMSTMEFHVPARSV
jgi:hypothetical protein